MMMMISREVFVLDLQFILFKSLSDELQVLITSTFRTWKVSIDLRDAVLIKVCKNVFSFELEV